jgi:hypothetical protein
VQINKKTTAVINTSGQRVRFSIANAPGVDPDIYELTPRETVEILTNYALPRLMQEGRDPAPSIISQLTNGLVLSITEPAGKMAYEAKLADEANQAKARKAG